MSRWPPAFAVSFERSRLLLAFILAVPGLAIAALFLSGLAPSLKCALGLTILIEQCHVLSRHGYLRTGRVFGRDGERRAAGVVVDRSGWRLVLANGSLVRAEFVGEGWITSRLILVSFREVASRRIHPIVLLPDSAPNDALRRLRVRLLHAGPQAVL